MFILLQNEILISHNIFYDGSNHQITGQIEKNSQYLLETLMFLRNIFKFQFTQSVGMTPLECKHLFGLICLNIHFKHISISREV